METKGNCTFAKIPNRDIWKFTVTSFLKIFIKKCKLRHLLSILFHHFFGVYSSSILHLDSVTECRILNNQLTRVSPNALYTIQTPLLQKNFLFFYTPSPSLLQLSNRPHAKPATDYSSQNRSNWPNSHAFPPTMSGECTLTSKQESFFRKNLAFGL